MALLTILSAILTAIFKKLSTVVLPRLGVLSTFEFLLLFFLFLFLPLLLGFNKLSSFSSELSRSSDSDSTDSY